jgi:uncharacterized membrane protein YoaK (UPF0700 family)
MEQRTLRSRLKEYFNAAITEDVLLEAEMLATTFATGIEDAVTYADFHCFVSNQTGNTVLLAIAVSRISPDIVSLTNIATSLSTFILGGWILGQLGNFLGCRLRGWLILSSLIQTMLVFSASGLQFHHSADRSGPCAPGVLSLLGLSAGGQVAMARSLRMTEITTANATSAYVDTFIDVNLYKFQNRARNRRFLFLLSLCGGSFTGSFAYLKLGSALTLLIAAVGKSLVTTALFFNGEIVNKQRSLDLDVPPGSPCINVV